MTGLQRVKRMVRWIRWNCPSSYQTQDCIRDSSPGGLRLSTSNLTVKVIVWTLYNLCYFQDNYTSRRSMLPTIRNIYAWVEMKHLFLWHIYMNTWTMHRLYIRTNRIKNTKAPTGQALRVTIEPGPPPLNSNKLSWCKLWPKLLDCSLVRYIYLVQVSCKSGNYFFILSNPAHGRTFRQTITTKTLPPLA